MTAQRSRSADAATFSAAYSAYVDGFLARRSVLDSTLFPEKPAQMWFGYDTVGAALADVTDWLARHIDPAELGRTFHRFGPRAPAILPVSALWLYHAALTGWSLEGRPWPEEAPAVLAYWRTVFEAYAARFSPPGLFLAGATSFTHHLVDADALDDAVAQLDPDAAADAGPFLAAATNYSWLTEAESRQGTYSHGLYPSGSRCVLAREFVNLAATRYPWIDRSADVMPTGPITIVLELHGVRGELDIYGVPQLEPQSYSDRIVAVAVRTDAGWLDDPATWFQHTAGDIQRAHLALFRTIASWDAPTRFQAGARSYVAMFEPALELAGATPADVRRLLLDPLDAALAQRLPAHIERAEPAPLWSWAADRGDRTIFAPVVERLS